MNHVCSTYAIDHSLMEFILYNIDLGINTAKFKSVIEKQFKFVNQYLSNIVVL